MKDFLFTDLISFVGEAPKKFDGYKKYVSTGAVNGNIIESDDIELVDYSSRPSRANLVACSGDILFAKMAETEKTLLLDDETEKNIYSTGFCAIRAKENIIEPKALYYLLGSSLFLNQKNTNSSGATQRAITNTGLSKIRIKLPTMEKQREFCGIMDKVVDSIELRKKQLGYFDELTKSLFIEMFGDPVENPFMFEKQRLSKIGELERGVSKHRPRNAPELLGGKYPLIQTGEISNSDLYINKFENTYSELGLSQSKLWKKGTLCITIAANIAKTGILTFDSCFPDSVVGFVPNKLTNNIFIHYWFSFFQKILEEEAPESAQKNINLKVLSNLDVIVPPIELQNKFAAVVAQIDKSKYSSFSHLSA